MSGCGGEKDDPAELAGGQTIDVFVCAMPRRVRRDGEIVVVPLPLSYSLVLCTFTFNWLGFRITMSPCGCEQTHIKIVVKLMMCDAARQLYFDSGANNFIACAHFF